jgi:prepilin-type N-terminal cleavage/methylation domain-containing protein
MMNSPRPVKSSVGFTLIEMLVVLALLGATAAIALIAVGNQGTTSAESACASDYNAVQTATDSYRQEVGVFPGGNLAALGNTANPSGAGDSPGIDALMGTITTASGATVGPWLKDDPVNPNRYEIQVTDDGLGTVGVYATGPYPTAQIPAAGATNTVSDCKSVH